MNAFFPQLKIKVPENDVTLMTLNKRFYCDNNPLISDNDHSLV